MQMIGIIERVVFQGECLGSSLKGIKGGKRLKGGSYFNNNDLEVRKNEVLN